MLKQQLILNAKNIIGWKTKRKIVVFGVDDYGNVRVDSKAAREKLIKAGLNMNSRFDQFDALENEKDLSGLYDVLDSVKDKNGNPAIFTALTVPVNINYEAMRQSNYSKYIYELLPETIAKLPGYGGTWNLWKDGIDKKLIYPQFHGREHLNLKIFRTNLREREHSTMLALDNRSYAGITHNPYPAITLTATYDFEEFHENEAHKTNIIDGLNAFEKVFGFRSQSFNPPAGKVHHCLYPTLKENGINFIETGLIKLERQGNGQYKRIFNYTGKKNKHGQVFTVRNCVFEPTDERGIDWVNFALQQVAAAFRWNRPAIISSHRVNFCGHIDPKNRETGLTALRALLKKIVSRWPNVEFMTTQELGTLISKSQSN